jgi:hypothetical protein
MDKNTIPEVPEYDGRGFKWGRATLVVPPLSCGQIKALTEHIDAISNPGDLTGFQRMLMHHVPVALAALRRNYPGMTVEDVEDFLDLSNFIEVYRAAMGRPLKEEPASPGEAQPVLAQSAGPTSIGGTSTAA